MVPERICPSAAWQIDIMDPAEDFSAGDFARLASEAAADIVSRGKAGRLWVPCVPSREVVS